MVPRLRAAGSDESATVVASVALLAGAALMVQSFLRSREAVIPNIVLPLSDQTGPFADAVAAIATALPISPAPPTET